MARLALGFSFFMGYASLQSLVDKAWHAPEVSPEPKLPNAPTNEENYDFAASLLT